MKTLYNLILSVIILTSCVGQKEDIMNENLQLSADKMSILADGVDETHFTLLYQGNDVTKDSEILHLTDKQSEKINEHRFSTTESGKHRFIGIYRNTDTNILEIQATQKEDDKQEGDFLRRSMIMKFTATWCVNCPNMTEAIKTAQEIRPNRIVDLAIHYIDEMETTDGKDYSKLFSINAIPVAVVNQDTEAQTSIASSTLLLNYIDRTIAKSLPTCGIKINSFEEDQELKIEVESTIIESGEYKLAVALVQDGIRKTQTGGGTDYIHNSVLKDYLQTPALGEELGNCQNNEIVNRTYTYPLNMLEKDGKYRIIAYILSNDKKGNYTVNNVTECNIRESIDYQYEPKEEMQ